MLLSGLDVVLLLFLILGCVVDFFTEGEGSLLLGTILSIVLLLLLGFLESIAESFVAKLGVLLHDGRLELLAISDGTPVSFLSGALLLEGTLSESGTWPVTIIFKAIIHVNVIKHLI